MWVKNSRNSDLKRRMGSSSRLISCFIGAVLDQEDAKRTGYQFRLILNWERDLF
jgi:hypothetical protein